MEKVEVSEQQCDALATACECTQKSTCDSVAVHSKEKKQNEQAKSNLQLTSQESNFTNKQGNLASKKLYKCNMSLDESNVSNECDKNCSAYNRRNVSKHEEFNYHHNGHYHDHHHHHCCCCEHRCGYSSESTDEGTKVPHDTAHYSIKRSLPVCTAPTASASEWIELNVSGTIFITTLTTLEVEPRSVLANIARRLRKIRNKEEEQEKLKRNQLKQKWEWEHQFNKRAKCYCHHNNNNYNSDSRDYSFRHVEAQYEEPEEEQENRILQSECVTNVDVSKGNSRCNVTHRNSDAPKYHCAHCQQYIHKYNSSPCWVPSNDAAETKTCAVTSTLSSSSSSVEELCNTQAPHSQKCLQQQQQEHDNNSNSNNNTQNSVVINTHKEGEVQEMRKSYYNNNCTSTQKVEENAMETNVINIDKKRTKKYNNNIIISSRPDHSSNISNSNNNSNNNNTRRTLSEKCYMHEKVNKSSKNINSNNNNNNCSCYYCCHCCNNRKYENNDGEMTTLSCKHNRNNVYNTNDNNRNDEYDDNNIEMKEECNIEFVVGGNIVKKNKRNVLRVDHDAANSILLDVDAQYFAPVLNYLRHGSIAIPPGVSVQGVRAVAEYLNIYNLADALTPPVPLPLTSIPRRRYLFSWGQGTSGELGTQLLNDTASPTLVQVTPFKEHVVQVTLGANYTLVRTNHGNVYSFGHGSWGQLGLGNPAELEMITGNRQLLLTIPRRIPLFEVERAMFIASGYAFAMAITRESKTNTHVYFWGNNNHGQSGLGPTFFHSQNKIYTPKRVEELEGKHIVKVCGGSYFSLALSADGFMYSWGNIECLGLGSPQEVEARFTGTDILAKSWNNEKRSVLLTPQRIHVPSNTSPSHLYHSTFTSSPSSPSFHATGLDTMMNGNTNTNTTTAATFTTDNVSNNNNNNNHNNNSNINVIREHAVGSLSLTTPLFSRMPSSLMSTSVLRSAQSQEMPHEHEPSEHELYNENECHSNTLLEALPRSSSSASASSLPEEEEEESSSSAQEEEEEQEESSSTHGRVSDTLFIPQFNKHRHVLREGNADKQTNEEVDVEEQETTREIRFTHINTGQWHSAAISTTGQLYTWGVGYQGRLGHGNTESFYKPTRVQGALEQQVIIDVACGSFHTVALTATGRVYCWGDNDLGQCGVISPSSIPAEPWPRFRNNNTTNNITNNNSNNNFSNTGMNYYYTANNNMSYVAPDRQSSLSNASEAITSPYHVVGLELIAGGVARGISCGRRHTAVVMSGPQPLCKNECCNTTNYQQEYYYNELPSYNNNNNIIENSNRRSKNIVDSNNRYNTYNNSTKSTLLHNKMQQKEEHSCLTSQHVVTSSASHGQVYVFGGLDMPNTSKEHNSNVNNHYNSNSNNNNLNYYESQSVHNVDRTRNRINNNIRNTRQRPIYYGHNANPVSNPNNTQFNNNNNNNNSTYSNSEYEQPHPLHSRSRNSRSIREHRVSSRPAPRPSSSSSSLLSSLWISSSNRRRREEEEQQQQQILEQEREEPLHDENELYRFTTRSHTNRYGFEYQQEYEEEEYEEYENIYNNQFEQLYTLPHMMSHSQTRPDAIYARHGRNVEHFLTGNVNNDSRYSCDDVNTSHHLPTSTLAHRPFSQYRRILGLESYNITRVICGLYHTFVFAEDVLPYHETHITDNVPSTSTLSNVQTKHKA